MVTHAHAPLPGLDLPSPAEPALPGTDAQARALSQWHTPAWLAKRMVAWAGAVGGRWLDPACGHGALMLAALEAPQAPFVTGVDLDPDSARHARRSRADRSCDHESALRKGP